MYLIQQMMKQNSNLDRVIECLQDQEKALRPKSLPSEEISKIHHHTIDLLNQFSEHIDRCKKYNEARIHRKYENTLTVLSEENQILKSRIKLYKEAIPSSQSYVSNLIDKMVELRNINERLMRDNEVLRYNTIVQTKERESVQSNRRDQLSQANMISNTIDRYLRRKKESSMEGRSDFQHFLSRSSLKSDKCTLYILLQKIEKWVQKFKEAPALNYHRIRQRIQRTHTSIGQTSPSSNLYETLDRQQSSQYVGKMKTQHIQRKPQQKIVFKRKKRMELSTNRSELVRLYPFK